MAEFVLTNSHFITPDQPAEEAVRVIFTVLLADLRKNITGTIEGRDPEHLHDLRVASRRTRSLLTQLKGVLPKGETRFFAAEFTWLGQLTGPCRDFDVWILERIEQRASQPADEAALLDPLDTLIAGRRARAHAAVIEGLRSHRFVSLLEGWDTFLQSPSANAELPKNARREVKALANKSISKAYQRVVRRSRDLNRDSPADKIHRLRIDAKKLRYLLEFFRTLYPETGIEARVGELKKLQDALGGFNDMAVQLSYLAEIRSELENEVGADTLHATKQLATTLSDRQTEFRHTVFERLEAFVGQSIQVEFSELIKTRN